MLHFFGKLMFAFFDTDTFAFFFDTDNFAFDLIQVILHFLIQIRLRILLIRVVLHLCLIHICILFGYR